MSRLHKSAFGPTAFCFALAAAVTWGASIPALAAPGGASLAPRAAPADTAALPYERYQLDNGLTVILHVDRSDPIAAVVMTFHVGSAAAASRPS
jgi:zinc protease